MTPKEKAKELFDKYQLAGSQWYVDTTKKYALIAVDEIWNALESARAFEEYDYWQEVKQEIQKL
jgi:hypothetical protein